MGVIWSFVRRSLAANKTRTAVSIIGVVLSTALLMAVFTTVTSLQHAIVESIIASEGTWQVFDSAAEDGWEEAFLSENRVTTVMSSQDVGVSTLASAEPREELGVQFEMLAVRSLPRTVKGTEEDARALTIQPTLLEGRLPENGDELLVPRSLVGLHASDAEGAPVWDDELAVGSIITLQLGQRTTPSGQVISSYYFASDYLNEDDEAIVGKEPDAPLEYITGATERTYTIVGVYEDQLVKINELGGADSCLVAFTAQDVTGTSTAVWVETDFFTSRMELASFFNEVLGQEDYYTHSDLLSFGGLTGSNAIWTSLWSIAGVLAATIMIAAISLIYNSFAISITERTRQYGLLSSLGASRRQLGWSVLLEASFIGLIGIPVGVLLGIVGVFVTLSQSSEAISDLLGTYAAETTGVYVSPTALVVVLILAIITLIISALVPALRAGRVSATDAIRQTRDVHLDRRTERRLARAGSQGQLLLSSQGLRERIGGMGGLLASRNLRRSGSRGRVVVASLAVSVLLLVSSGAIAQALSSITDRYQNIYATDSSDIVVYIYRSSEDGSDSASKALESVSSKMNEIDELDFELSVANMNVKIVLPSGMSSEELIRSGVSAAGASTGGVYPNGSYAGWGSLLLVDDATWQSMAEGAGVDTEELGEGLHALALNLLTTNDESGRYISLSPIAKTETATVYTFDDETLAKLVGDDLLQRSTSGLLLDDGGNAQLGFVDYTTEGMPLVKSISADEAASTKEDIDIVGIVDDIPGDLYTYSILSNFPVLVLPLSQYENVVSLGTIWTISLTYNIADGADMDVVGPEIDNALQGLPDNTNGFWQNAREGLESTRRILDMVYLFIFLFSLITMLIAVANVFNTLSNNIILRTREFAVLKSCGMDNKAFARMLVSECASYAIRGLVIGLGLATLAAYFIWEGMSASFAERPFTLPWGYVAAAIIGVVVVLAISVAYALRRSHALNVVEALRADAI